MSTPTNLSFISYLQHRWEEDRYVPVASDVVNVCKGALKVVGGIALVVAGTVDLLENGREQWAAPGDPYIGWSSRSNTQLGAFLVGNGFLEMLPLNLGYLIPAGYNLADRNVRALFS